ncbi:SUKH-4 family immunity protein [Actinomadura sp. LOL_016]|uniref:SUKH-4 family immunity protein n=1 Tax=unclassified Actinomadura TaxID=2626254 RepID=UPI003A80503D
MATELTAATLESAFPDIEVIIRPAAESIPAAISHAPTRAFLSTTGLPCELHHGAVDIYDLHEGHWETLPELWEAVRGNGWSWTMPETPEHWFSLGGIFGSGLLVLNGENGQVWLIPEADEGDLTHVHSGVDSLAYYMYAVQRASTRLTESYALSIEHDADDPRDEFDAYLDGARALAVELYEADPTPFVNGPEEPWEDDGEGPWAWMLRDIGEGAWAG